MATASPTIVHVTFIFANFEKKVILATTLSSSGADLKRQLVENWPEGIPLCEDRSRIRMICMGNGFLTDDKILGPKFPVFLHPTPINVSIRPKLATPTKSTTMSTILGGSTVSSPSRINGSGSTNVINNDSNNNNSNSNSSNSNNNNSNNNNNNNNNSSNNNNNDNINMSARIPASGTDSRGQSCPRIGVIRPRTGQNPNQNSNSNSTSNSANHSVAPVSSGRAGGGCCVIN